MAHTEQININGVLTNVRVFDETAQEIDDAAAKSKWQSNPNLLDNWYFADPVNQRGQSTYSGVGYTIDRWVICSSGLGVTVSESGLTITETDNSENCILDQRCESVIAAALHGKTVTASILVSAVSGAFVAQCASAGVDVASAGLHTFTTTFDSSVPFIFRIYNKTGLAQMTVEAVKLELGTQQTLAHKDERGNWVLNDPPPNKQQELAKCQRYFQLIPRLRIKNFPATSILPLIFPVKMRDVPSISVETPADVFSIITDYANDHASIEVNSVCDGTAFNIAFCADL